MMCPKFSFLYGEKQVLAKPLNTTIFDFVQQVGITNIKIQLLITWMNNVSLNTFSEGICMVINYLNGLFLS